MPNYTTPVLFFKVKFYADPADNEEL